VGTAAVQLARHLGAEWVTGVCSGANGEMVRSLGADEVVDYTREDFTERPERYDLVLDTVGKAARRRAATALSPGGRFVSVNQGAPRFTAQELTTLTDLAESGALRPVIDRTYPLEEIVQAHRYVDTRRKRGNVVVTLER
jgi:alcohol dehydrogenase